MQYKEDIYRYYGKYNETIYNKIFRPNGLKFLKAYRTYNGTKSSFYKLILNIKIKYLSRKTMIQIYPKTRIGKGLYIGHDGPIIVNPDAIIGNNVNIAAGVVIGQENRGKRIGAPKIGNQVWIGANSVIVGNINIGDDVLIAPLSYVNIDVPSHSIVIGNPAKIIKKNNATEKYINNKVN